MGAPVLEGIRVGKPAAELTFVKAWAAHPTNLASTSGAEFF
jgi:hypothetical protein